MLTAIDDGYVFGTFDKKVVPTSLPSNDDISALPEAEILAYCSQTPEFLRNENGSIISMIFYEI